MNDYCYINRWKRGGHHMDFDFTQYQYRPECLDGCGELTDWVYSKETANDAGRNHQHEKGHSYEVRERMKPGM